ncbi:MAG TPA: MmgE/PrpD family protein [Candidatus Acidoferrales bacterium]|nr:MmgE/PrpD family protein [Candidatus Acidoferrales bacterium]
MASSTERLVDIALGIRFDSLPAEVVREAKRRLLDALGCMIAGARGVTTERVRKAVFSLGGVPEATLFGTQERTSCDRAALVNGTALRFLDFMDGHPGPYPCHPCFNIPPALAVAERERASGKKLITAIVTGYEIMPRFQENVGLPDLGARGWAGSSNLAFSIPLGCAHLLGLDREGALNALGLSVLHGAVLDTSSHGQMPASKSLLDGMVAQQAVLALLLAERGVSGPHEVLEGEAGYVRAVAGACKRDGLLAPVGKYKILESYTKLYNTVKCGQTAVAAALALAREPEFNWRDITAIEIGLAKRDADNQTRNASYARPKNRDTANHSVRYSVAAALVEGELGEEQFAEEKLRSPDILKLIDRTRVYHEKDHDAHWPRANPATIWIRSANRTQFWRTVIVPPGHPDNPVSDEALEQKFRQLTRKFLSPEQISEVIEIVRQLDRLDDVRHLTAVLRRS